MGDNFSFKDTYGMKSKPFKIGSKTDSNVCYHCNKGPFCRDFTMSSPHKTLYIINFISN